MRKPPGSRKPRLNRRHLIHRLLLVIAAAFAAGTLTTFGAENGASRDWRDALQLYASGQFDAGVAAGLDLGPAEFALDPLLANCPDWLADETLGADPARRRTVVAAFAVEIAASPGPVLGTMPIGEFRGIQLSRRRIVAWAGAMLAGSASAASRTGGSDGLRLEDIPDPTEPVTPAEETWFQAAIAAMRLNGWGGLIALPADVSLDSPRTYPLVTFAEARFPAAPWVRLAGAATEEFFGWGALGTSPQITMPLNSSRMMNPTDVSMEIRNVLGGSDATRGLLRRKALSQYEGLTAVPVVSADAHLRAGYLRLIGSDDGKARQHFASAVGLDDDVPIRFVAHLLTGFSFERTRKTAEAEASYRAALALAPGARSASALLSMLLVTTDRIGEARTLAPALLARAQTGDDPWDDFVLGPRPRWPEARDQLRRQLEPTR